MKYYYNKQENGSFDVVLDKVKNLLQNEGFNEIAQDVSNKLKNVIDNL
tara:strand:- start:4164 stop:4307 length:144 start_codon:yes stop_codon:yes gene_type:complete